MLDPSPMLDPVSTKKVTNEEGEEVEEHWVQSGKHLKMVNLSLNLLGDEIFESLKEMLGRAHDDFEIVLSYNKFSGKVLSKIRKQLKQVTIDY
jgi:hypothetical protein